MTASSTTSTVTERMALRPDARLERADDGSSKIRFQFREIAFPALPPAIMQAFTALGAWPGMAMPEFIREVTSAGHAALPRGLWLLGELRRWGLLSRTLEHDGRPALSAVPIAAETPPPHPQLDAAAGPAILSRFAILRRDGADFVLESPLAHHRIVLHDPALLPLLGRLAAPFDRGEAAGGVPDLDPALVSAAVRLLDDCGMLSSVGDDGLPSDEQPPWRAWEVHDLYFHSRSRRGRHANPYGGTYRHIADNVPALKPAPADAESLALPTPSPDGMADPSLETVLLGRRSIRKHSETPLTLGQLAEFLHRTVRVTGYASNEQGEWTRRRYPGGGGLYELEVYPVVGACDGLAPGLYHYRPKEHALTPMQAVTPQVTQLLREAAITAAMSAPPQVLLVITSRFTRVSSKYESMAYALCLKDTGVLLQTMYLVAAAMGLAPCALGGGDSDLFARASGLDYFTEGAVGELVLGRAAEEEKAEG
jgi:SagB-type dehydrogenase family enzyme